jgi:type III restriction enzyme
LRAPLQPSEVKSKIFSGFKKAGHTLYKFDSDTERQLAVLLEDTALVTRWERLNDDQARDTFNLR